MASTPQAASPAAAVVVAAVATRTPRGNEIQRASGPPVRVSAAGSPSASATPAREEIQEARDRTVELRATQPIGPVLPGRRARDVAGDGRAVPLADLFGLADHQVAFAHRPSSIVTRPAGACTS